MKFSGRFADFSLPDILRILIQGQKTGALVVNYQEQDSKVFVKSGVLHHAESHHFQGEKAVYDMLNFEPVAEFEFVESTNMPEQTIHSDLDSLIQNGISYLESWRKITRSHPRISMHTEIEFKDKRGAVELSDAEQAILQQRPQESPSVHMYHLLEHVELDPQLLVEALQSLEKKGFLSILAEKRAEMRRFFLVASNTLLDEFYSISGLKLKQETVERLEKLIQENNWMIELQNGRIVDDKLQSSSLEQQAELYRQCLNHLFKTILPIYGEPFLQQVMSKVEKHLSNDVEFWIRELKLEL